MLRLRKGLVAAVLATVVALVPIAAFASTVTGISGYEVSPGVSYGGATYGASFVGWTNTATVPTTWQPAPSSTGGEWAITVNYVRTSDSAATVFGGYWSLETSTGERFSGKVVPGGTVVWLAANPACTGNESIGVDVASVTLQIKTYSGILGTVNGCLDDQHPGTVFPPQVWGTVSLG